VLWCCLSSSSSRSSRSSSLRDPPLDPPSCSRPGTERGSSSSPWSLGLDTRLVQYGCSSSGIFLATSTAGPLRHVLRHRSRFRETSSTGLGDRATRRRRRHVWLISASSSGSPRLEAGQWQDRVSMGFAPLGVSAPRVLLGPHVAVASLGEMALAPPGRGTCRSPKESQWFLHFSCHGSCWRCCSPSTPGWCGASSAGDVSTGLDAHSTRQGTVGAPRGPYQHGCAASSPGGLSLFGADLGTLLRRGDHHRDRVQSPGLAPTLSARLKTVTSR